MEWAECEVALNETVKRRNIHKDKQLYFKVIIKNDKSIERIEMMAADREYLEQLMIHNMDNSMSTLKTTFWDLSRVH